MVYFSQLFNISNKLKPSKNIILNQMTKISTFFFGCWWIMKLRNELFSFFLEQSQARIICKIICKLHNWKVFLLLEVGSHCHLRAIIQEFTCGPTTRKQSSPNPRGDDGNPPSGHQVARRSGDSGAAAAVAGRNLSYYFNSLHIQLQPGSIIRQIIQSLTPGSGLNFKDSHSLG